mmetsp:Transcript_41520/g.56621  ORF Transcript_41520/g.56621 Transcript_41520/m.56621 type:complete len:330 (-) Transcript_41520:544-1533(-)
MLFHGTWLPMGGISLLLFTSANGWKLPTPTISGARCFPFPFLSATEGSGCAKVENRKFQELGYAKGGFLLRTWKTALQHDLALGILPADTHPGWFDDLERRNRCNVQFEFMESNALKLAVLEKASPDSREGGAWEALAPEIRHARLFVTMSVGLGSTIAFVSSPPDESTPWDVLGLGSAPTERDLKIVAGAEAALIDHISAAARDDGRACRIKSSVLDTLISSETGLKLEETNGSSEFRVIAPPATPSEAPALSEAVSSEPAPTSQEVVPSPASAVDETTLSPVEETSSQSKAVMNSAAEDILVKLESLTLLEAAELVKQIEEKFGVDA